ncbi:hypothetical protein [Marinobacter psychrophilus]|nr:hypothetical protein [Marinobacter psychrophilus]
MPETTAAWTSILPGPNCFFATVLGRNLLLNATVRGTRANSGAESAD